MAEMWVAIRGEKKTFLPQFSVGRDGYLSGPGGAVLIDSGVPGFEARKTEIMGLLTAKQYSRVPKEFCAKPGVNPSGLRVITMVEFNREEDARRGLERAAWRESHPGWEERAAIERLFDKAERGRYSEAFDGGLYYSIKGEAEERLAAWRAQYPREAAEERVNDLRARAAKQEHLAVGALVYDCDGSLSRADQQRRCDEFRAKRDEYECRAAEIAAEFGLE